MKPEFDDIEMLDIAEPEMPIDIHISKGPIGHTLWVNLGPKCILRICQIQRGITVDADTEGRFKIRT